MINIKTDARQRSGKRALGSKMFLPVAAILLASCALPSVVMAASIENYVSFDIHDRDMETSLLTFAKQADIQLVMDPADVRGISASHVVGKFTADEALQHLLKNSGLTFQWVGERTLTISRPQRINAVDPAGAKMASDGQLEDIVVTATRREERLQQVPISVTAIDGESLVRSGISQTNGLTQVTPGLNFSRVNSIFQPQIRGVGSRTAAPGDESSVAVYVDGIYQPEAFAASFDLLKVSRAEVLRGPQGTLFGRNATGGLINIITPDPQQETSGEITARVGNIDERSVRGYVTTGLTDKLAVDLSALAYDDGGFVKDIVREGHIAERTSYALRSKMKLDASDNATFVLMGNYLNNEDSLSAAFTPINRNTKGRAVQPSVILPSGPYESALSIIPHVKVEQWGLALQGRFKLGEVDLETTTSYQNNHLDSFTDGDASPVNLTLLNFIQTGESYAQEVRLLGTFNRLKWIAGIYGYYSNSAYDPVNSYSYPGGVQKITSSTNRNRTRSIAAFGEATYAVTDAFNVIMGLRYTYEDRHFRAGPTGLPIVTDANTSNERVTPRAIAQYNINSSSQVYASYSQGFKSGVFNTSGFSPTPVRPETIDSYEIGLKSDLTSAIRLNLSAFHYDYKDLQNSVRDPNSGVSFLQNAASARLNGGEAELTAVVTNELTLKGAFSYLDTSFKSFPNALVTIPLPAGGNSQASRDVSGNNLTRSPKYTASLNVDYRHQMANGSLIMAGNIFHSGKFYWDNLNRLVQPAYTQANAQIGYEMTNGLGVSFWVENILNETIMASVNTSVNADYASYLPFRRYGMTATKKF